MRRHKGGFTIIELMLAMAFVSFLLLSIAMTTIQAGNMYNRGLTLRGVNQVGRDIDGMLRRDFLQTDSRRIVRPSAASSRVIRLSDPGQLISGRFCLGQYSYLWNDPWVLDRETDISHSAIVRDASGQPINFVRVVDEDARLCEQVSGHYPNSLAGYTSVTQLLKTRTSGEEVVLGIHSFDVVALTYDSVTPRPEGLYRVQYTVGTTRVSEINTSNQSCRPPSDTESNFQFCAINQFDTIVRTNG